MRLMATKPDMLLGFDSFDKGQPTTGSNDFLIKWLLVTNSRDKYKAIQLHIDEINGYRI